MLELGLEAAQRPLGQVLVEVGHHADGVRQLGALVEGAAALEVDEHEGEVVGVDRRRPAPPPSTAAARTCRRRSCRRPGRGGRRPRSRSRRCRPRPRRSGVAGRGSGPAAFQRASDRLGGALVEVEQGQQPDRGGQPGADEVELGVLEAGQRPGAVAGDVVGHAGRQRSRGCASPTWGSVRSATPPGSVTSTTVVHTAGSRSAVEATTMPATSPASPRSRLRVGRPAALGQRLVVDHDQQRRADRRTAARRAARAGRAGPAALSRASTMAVDSSASAGQQAARRRWRRGCGAATWPSPSRRPAADAGEDHHRQVGRAVQRRRLADQRPGHGQGRRPVADDADDPAARQVERARRCPGSVDASSSSVGQRLGRLGRSSRRLGHRRPARARRRRRRAGAGSRGRRAGAPTASRWAARRGARSRPDRGGRRLGGGARRRRRLGSWSASSASSRANRSRSLRSVFCDPCAWRRWRPPMPMTGESMANSRNWALLHDLEHDPGEDQRRDDADERQRHLALPGWRAARGAGRSGGGTGSAGRGGRLNGMVPAGARLTPGVVAERAVVVVDGAHLELEGAEAQRTPSARAPPARPPPRPPTHVPLCDSRSSTVSSPSASRVSAAWRRDSVVSGQDDLAAGRTPDDDGAGSQREPPAGVEPVDDDELVRRGRRSAARRRAAASGPRPGIDRRRAKRTSAPSCSPPSTRSRSGSTGRPSTSSARAPVGIEGAGEVVDRGRRIVDPDVELAPGATLDGDDLHRPQR